MERNLLDYLPLFMQEYEEIKEIMGSEQTEFSDIWNSSDNLMKDQFVSAATEVGISMWEDIFGIVPKASDNLEERRFRIKLKLNEKLPYTVEVVQKQLQSLCGEGYEFNLNTDAYKLDVELPLENKSNYQDVVDYLNMVVPANIVITVRIPYNNYGNLIGFTHGQLAALTYEDLRGTVLSSIFRENEEVNTWTHQQLASYTQETIMKGVLE